MKRLHKTASLQGHEHGMLSSEFSSSAFPRKRNIKTGRHIGFRTACVVHSGLEGVLI